MKKEQAVVILVYSPEYDAYLCVSRKSGLFGLPGGKVEKGDINANHAICREVLEELGIRCFIDEVEYMGYVVNANYEIYIYTPKSYLHSLILEQYPRSNMITPENETTDYLSIESLCDKSICEFYEENIGIIQVCCT